MPDSVSFGHGGVTLKLEHNAEVHPLVGEVPVIAVSLSATGKDGSRCCIVHTFDRGGFGRFADAVAQFAVEGPQPIQEVED